MEELEKCTDPRLWTACAGGMVQIPPVNATVFYFPQGHAEHSQSPADFSSSLRIPPLVLCRVAAVNHIADSESDEVYAKVSLVPLPPNNDFDFVEEIGISDSTVSIAEKPASFSKTLTQSDANNGGGFSVPRYCAETIFPRLNYSADPPVQTLVAKDVHGEIWKFRHIYRGTPRRHLLTTGWSSFVNKKKLVAGDSIVFSRAENGGIGVGIRRARRGLGIGSGSDSGWSTNSGCGGGFSLLDESQGTRNGGLRAKGRVKAEEVVEAAARAANGQPFEVVYYPRANTPEFFVKASSVVAAMRTRWCSGMRFKMAFETDDSTRNSWFMGTVASAQAFDPIRWPNSPWRLLQVTWDEPDLLKNVKRVSPWLVELVSNMPIMNLSPFSPPRKKLRLPPQHLDFPLDGQFQFPSFLGNPVNPLRCLTDNTPAGIQGARHTQFGVSLSDLQLNNKLRPGLFLSSLQQFNDSPSNGSESYQKGQVNTYENLSCLLTMGNSNTNTEKSDNVKRRQFLLFGQPIFIEQEISPSCSTVSQVLSGKFSSDESPEKEKTDENQTSPEKSASTGFSWQSVHSGEAVLDANQCSVFSESKNVGLTLDLCALGSYEEQHIRLADMFEEEKSEISNHVLYRDAIGAVKPTGDEPFSVINKMQKD